MLEIVKAPNPVLSSKAQPVSKVDSSILKLIEQMEESMLAATDPKGVGLAAPQIGKSLQIFIAKPSEKSKFHVFINPEIISEGKLESISKSEKHTKLEGCLSLPNIWGEVLRSPFVELAYLDEKGIKRTRKFTGFMAVIIQHEQDHLRGVLFPKRVLEQGGTLYKSEKDEKGQDVFEELKI